MTKFTGHIGDSDIHLLRVFRTVVECGGFTRAESELGLTCSTISSHISNLEQRLGTCLCERGRGGFFLTEHGHVVYNAMIRLSTALETFRSEVAVFHQDVVGELNIGVVDSILTLSEISIADVIAAYNRAAPNVHIRLLTMSTDQSERRLMDETIHVAIVSETQKRSGIRYEYATKESHQLYCGRGHALYHAEEEKITAEELLRWKHVSYRETVFGYIDHTALPIQPSASSNSLETQLILIMSGQFLGFLPTPYAAPYEEAGYLKVLAGDHISTEQSFCVATRDIKRHSKPLEIFLDILRGKIDTKIS